MSGSTHTPDAKTILQHCFSIAKLINKFRSQDQYSQLRSMSHAHLDVLATRIPLGQITDHTKNPTRTGPMKHPKNPMKTIMKLFRTRYIANIGKTLTKNTTNRDTFWNRFMDNLLTLTNKQIKLSTACNRYPCIEASTSTSTSNQHTQTWIAN